MSWDWWTPRAAKRTRAQELTIELFNFALVVGLLVGGSWFMGQRIFDPNRGPEPHTLGDTTMNEPGFVQRCGPPSPGPHVVTWVHTPQLSPWIEPASTAFMRACPNTQIRLLALEDIDAARAIVAGEVEPTIWSPSDSSMLELLEARWSRDLDRAQLPLQLELEASLVNTPMVLLIWRDRRELLERVLAKRLREHGALAAAVCAGVSDELASLATRELERGVNSSPSWVPASWEQLWLAAHPAPTELPPTPPLGELQRWGRVRIAHASPISEPLGLLSLYLISREYIEPSAQLDGKELASVFQTQHERLLAWLRRCEGGLDAPLPSARLLTQTMFNLGDPALDPRAFDAVLTSEQLAFDVLERIDEHEAALEAIELVYPSSALQLDYPVAVVGDPRPVIHDAALRFMNFLLDPREQARALQLGFRPAIDDPRVSLREYDSGPNPFVKLRRHGVELTPQLDSAPRVPGETLLELVDTWRAATGR